MFSLTCVIYIIRKVGDKKRSSADEIKGSNRNGGGEIRTGKAIA